MVVSLRGSKGSRVLNRRFDRVKLRRKTFDGKPTKLFTLHVFCSICALRWPQHPHLLVSGVSQFAHVVVVVSTLAA